MASLRVLNRNGDLKITWNPADLARGDSEALAAIREAERIFAQERARGAMAFRVHHGATAERLDALDPFAEETVVIPPMVGGWGLGRVAGSDILIALGALVLVLGVTAFGVIQLVSNRSAAQRGRMVVQDLLTPVELDMLLKYGYVDVPSRGTADRIYRIPAQPGMVTVIDAGLPTARLCMVPACTVPEQEQVVIHKLMLEAAEADYWKCANRFAGGPCSWSDFAGDVSRWTDAPRVAVWTGRAPGVIGQRWNVQATLRCGWTRFGCMRPGRG
jgi:hypothetical protein